ncbi:beta strand repeat-containing protein [Halomonas sp. NCCP-2165]|nr:DUF5801 repeats-in-toxin domain-containing protein [Halomonas sp. NCCP-2165]GKW49804.1 hypothetical protein NCCP2165_20190 [Halomonas sp. NCCP-2165]
MSEDILEVTSAIKVDESPSEQDDDISVADGETLFADLYNLFGTPANLAFKAGMISTPDGLTTIGWAADADGTSIEDLASNLKALDPDTDTYETVTLNTDPSDDNILIGRTESGNVAFIAVIVPSADGTSSDVYLLDYLPKQHADGSNPDDTTTLNNLFVNVTVEETLQFDFEGAPSGNNDFMAFGESGGVAIVVTGRSAGETVNSSKSNNEPTSLAANSNNINAGEGLVVTYVNEMDPNYLVPDLSGPEASDPANIQFGSLQSATEGSVTIVKVGPGNTTATVELTALFTAQEEGTGFIPGIADDTVIEITAVYVNDVAVAFTTDASGTVKVTGITNNDVITFETAGDHNRFMVENGGTGNARFNIGGVALADINTQSDADAITLEFDDDGPGDPTVALSGTDPVGLTFDGGLSGGNFTGTESGDDTNGSPTVAVVDFSTAFTIGNQDDFGADGAGQTDIDYALQLATGVSEGDSSGLTSDGEAINLYINGDGTLVTGSTAADEGSVAAGNTIFTLALNSTTGVLTQTQSGVIDHDQTDTYDGAYISDEQALADGLVELVASAETTDSEGDTSGVNSEALDLGGNVRFGDDGPGDPTVALSGADPVGLTFDGGLSGGNFTGTESGDDTNGSPTVAVVDFSTAFTIGNQDDFGADGGGQTDIDYTLQLAAGVSEGDSSGLTSDGEAINLYINGDGTLVTGSTAADEGSVAAGNTIFTLALNSTTGVLTQTQSGVIDHSQTDTYDGAYISDEQALADGLVELVASAETTDSEGDTSGVNSEALDLGGNVRFGDDGPGDPTVTLSGTDPVGLTFDGGLSGGNFTGTESGDDTNGSPTVAVVDFSTAFTIGNQDDFGADGGGQTDIDYALQLAAGVSEGDPSGLTSDGDPINLYINGDGTLVTGSTAADEGSVTAGNTIFTLVLNSTTGVLTQTQSGVIDHDQTDTYDGAYISDEQALADGLVELVASAETTDSEGDTSGVNSEALDLGGNVRFGDDGPGDPTVTLSGTDPVGLTFDGGLSGGNFTGTESGDDTNGSPTVAVVDFSTAFTIGNQDDFGADGAGQTDIDYALQLATGVSEGDSSGLTSDGEAINLYINGDGTLVTGSTAADEGSVAAGNTIFTLVLNSTTGVLTQTQSGVIDHGKTDTYDGAYIVDEQALADGLVELVASAETTDSEGDTSGVNSEALDLGGNVRFGDDGPGDPTVALNETDPVGLTFDGGLSGGNFTGTESGDDTNASPTVAVVDFSTAFTIGNQDDFGADGAGQTDIDYALQLAVAEGTASGLTSGGEAINLYINGDGTLVTGSTAADEGSVAAGNTIFTLALNSTTGVLTQTQSGVIDHGQTDTYDGAYISDEQALADGLVELVASAETTDSEGDTSGVNSEALDLGGNVRFGDDGPTIAVGDASGTYPEPESEDPAKATGTFVDGPGADGFADLAITFDSYEIDDNGPIQTSDPDASVTFMESVTDTTWTGTITDDFNGDGESETVEFTLDVDLDNDTYMVTLDTPPAQEIVLSTADGSLDAGGPDPVRTLTLLDSSQVVFSAVDPTASSGDISLFLNQSEAAIEAGATYLSDDEMNVSTAGIGNGNNNFNGNALSGIDGNVTQGGKVDESFVVDPTGFNVSSVKVYIDNSVGGYDNPPEELYYRVYYADGTVSAETLVTDAHPLSPEAGGQVSFTIGDPEGPNDIDAVQLFMGTGTIKIPVIEFTTSEQFDPDPLALNFTATLEDGDQDTAAYTFSVDFDALL